MTQMCVIYQSMNKLGSTRHFMACREEKFLSLIKIKIHIQNIHFLRARGNLFKFLTVWLLLAKSRNRLSHSNPIFLGHRNWRNCKEINTTILIPGHH